MISIFTAWLLFVGFAISSAFWVESGKWELALFYALLSVHFSIQAAVSQLEAELRKK